MRHIADHLWMASSLLMASFFMTMGVSQYQKGKSLWILMKQQMMG